MVPRWRTAGSPIEPGTSERTFRCSFMTGEFATSPCLVMAPTTTERPFSSTPDSPSTCPMSMMSDGFASRSFITGISEWPPAKSFASGSLVSRLAACRTVVGR
jgi:hypothetical protein